MSEEIPMWKLRHCEDGKTANILDAQGNKLTRRIGKALAIKLVDAHNREIQYYYEWKAATPTLTDDAVIDFIAMAYWPRNYPGGKADDTVIEEMENAHDKND